MPPTATSIERPVVRRLRPEDLEAVIALDARITGRRREEYFKVKLDQALKETGIEVSLAAETDGIFAGFLLSRVFYGEFGEMDPSAVLDTIGVHPDFRGKGIGRALLRQLRTNLLGLGLPALHTEVSWDNQNLLHFFHSIGMAPAPRICLDWDLEAARRVDDLADPPEDSLE
ncbi:MAG: GNAT family N-acetyltransferase [Planctomycetota bacterium]|jgi:ribosomal protein S18 acetylase RimI-like enzyme